MEDFKQKQVKIERDKVLKQAEMQKEVEKMKSEEIKNMMNEVVEVSSNLII